MLGVPPVPRSPDYVGGSASSTIAGLCWGFRQLCWRNGGWATGERLFEADGGAVNQHLGGLCHDSGSGEAHTYNGVSVHLLRLCHHAVGGHFAGLVHHVGIGFKLATHNVFQGLSEIAEHIFGLYGTAGNGAKHFKINARQIFNRIKFNDYPHYSEQ